MLGLVPRYRCGSCGELGHNARTCGRQAAPPPPPEPEPATPATPKRVKRPRVDGHNHCSECGELGHTAQRHKREQSPSVRGAMIVRAEGITFQEAGDRVGVSHQAVQQAYRTRFGEMASPHQQKIVDRARRAAELVAAGHYLEEVAAAIGVSPKRAYEILRRHGVQPPPRVSPHLIDAADIAQAAALVAGGGSYADAAAAIGSGHHQIADRLRAIGVASSATGRGRMDGRTKRAIERVRAGASVPEACRAENCATPLVYRETKDVRAARGPIKHGRNQMRRA